jgi:hypothetical protein
MKRRFALVLTTVALAVVMVALPAFAWRAEISGDCEGWHITNPDIKKWNSADYELVVDSSIVVPFMATVDIADSSGSAERTFHLFWRLVGDTEQIEPQDVLATREACEATTTTAVVAGETAEATTTTAEATTTTDAGASATTAPAVVLGIQVSAPSGVAAQAETLPFTGVSTSGAVATASGLLAAGAACLVWAQRHRVESDS